MSIFTDIYKKELLTIKSFPSFFIFAVILNLAMLTIFSISIDDEYSAFRSDHSMWVMQGRWMIYLLQSFILPQAVVPYLPHLIFVFFMTGSYLCLIRAHDLQVDFFSYLLFPIFCIFPIWTFIGVFYANIPAVGLGLFLISFAAYLFRCLVIEKSNAYYLMIIQILLVTIAIGTYQSFLFAFCSMCLGVIAYTHIKQGICFAKIRSSLIMLAVILLSSTLIYFIINNIFLYMLNVKTAYIGMFYNPDILLSEPIKTIFESLKQMKETYSSSSLYGVSFEGIGALMLLGIYAVLVNKNLPRIIDKIMIVGLVFMLALAPFALNFFSNGLMPLRTLVGVPYVVWFSALLALINHQKIIRALVMILIVVGIFQIMYANSLYAASLQLRQTHDEMLANSLYQRIIDVHPNFDRTKIYPVAFYGPKFVELPYPKVLSSTISESFFSWDYGSATRMVSYMKLIGFNNLEVAANSDDFISYFKDMPNWPAAGSVKVVSDVTLIKLGDKI